jgi:predicted dehydrogenase
MSYDDLKVIEAHDFLSSVVGGRSRGADAGDAVRAAVVLDALAASAAGRRWADVPS